MQIFKNKIVGQIELLANLDQKDLYKISEYFKKQIKKEFNTAIIEYFELSR